ncbi:TIGR03643 family protein [Undibacterium sp.]|uniref:TIGR03643 family protein n=1 Tax=Undibacterium sp. TaxID=1914977 RepID=UPI003750D468
MQQIDQATIDRVIQMALEDRTSFDAIQRQFGLDESAVIRLMRSAMRASSFKMWRTRVTGRKTKHQALRGAEVMRFKSSDQKNRDF